MKRRHFVQALVGTPAATALLAQQAVPGGAPNGASPAPPADAASDAIPALQASNTEMAGDYTPKFFSAPQYSALTKLSVTLMPGALDANTPQFLDFLLSQSVPDKQNVYLRGLDALNAQSQSKFRKPFSDLDNAQVSVMLEPLRKPWTYADSSDPVERVLRAAKADVRIATTNAAPTAAPAGGGRRFAGSGQYWYPLD